MLVAAKHLDLRTSVLNVSAIILERLEVEKAASMDDVLNLVERELGYDARFNVLPALAFLYLLGSVKYLPASDALVYEPRSVGVVK